MLVNVGWLLAVDGHQDVLSCYGGLLHCRSCIGRGNIHICHISTAVYVGVSIVGKLQRGLDLDVA